MRYGAMNFPVLPVLQEIEAIGRLNMDFLELAMDAPQAHVSSIRQQKDEIVRAVESAKMGLVCHLPTFVYTAHLSDTIRQASLNETIASLETAVELGAEKVVVHPGSIDGLAAYVPDYATALVLESLAIIYRRAEVLEIPLCIENMFSRVCPFVEPEDFNSIFASFPKMKLLLDVGHANIDDAEGRRAVRFIQQFSDRLEHLHVSDNHGRVDEHLPLGEGSVGWKAILRALRAAAYDGTVTLEIFGEDRSALVRGRKMLDVLWQK